MSALSSFATHGTTPLAGGGRPNDQWEIDIAQFGDAHLAEGSANTNKAALIGPDRKASSDPTATALQLINSWMVSPNHLVPSFLGNAARLQSVLTAAAVSHPLLWWSFDWLPEGLSLH